ncbi:uncharacterized protein A4U43_C01F24160 [Asparagus officinalis]|uniref:Uncharacterized protein n=1 Tax=Asparagus officinalis TaxID=4686 RepID=A0A5P1FV99_ASPOF|nr:uncharacterized protein A4U43_C01F24160 [Asparagus officinalis]
MSNSPRMQVLHIADLQETLPPIFRKPSPILKRRTDTLIIPNHRSSGNHVICHEWWDLVRIPEFLVFRAMVIRVAANSGVIKDITEPVDYGGFPAVPIHEWHRQSAKLRYFFKQ